MAWGSALTLYYEEVRRGLRREKIGTTGVKNQPERETGELYAHEREAGIRRTDTLPLHGRTNHVRMHPQPGDQLNLSTIQEGAEATGVAIPEEKTATGLFPGTHSSITNPMHHPIPKLKVIHVFHPHWAKRQPM
jgi:hypothetical protein